MFTLRTVVYHLLGFAVSSLACPYYLFAAPSTASGEKSSVNEKTCAEQEISAFEVLVDKWVCLPDVSSFPLTPLPQSTPQKGTEGPTPTASSIKNAVHTYPEILSGDELPQVEIPYFLDDESYFFVGIQCHKDGKNPTTRLVALPKEESTAAGYRADADPIVWSLVCDLLESALIKASEEESPTPTSTPTPTGSVTPVASATTRVCRYEINGCGTDVPTPIPTGMQSPVQSPTATQMPTYTSVPVATDTPQPKATSTPLPPGPTSTVAASPTVEVTPTHTPPAKNPSVTPVPTRTPTKEAPLFLGYNVFLTNIGAGPRNDPDKPSHRSIPEDPLDEFLFFPERTPYPTPNATPAPLEIRERAEESNQYLEAREEFTTEFDSPFSPFYVYYTEQGSSAKWLSLVTYEEAKKLCTSKAALVIQPYSRLSTVTEAKHFGSYFAEMLATTGATKKEKCFFLSPGTEPGDDKPKIYCPYWKGFEFGYNLRDIDENTLAGVHCVAPKTTPYEDNFDSFVEQLATIPPYHPRYHDPKLLAEDERKLIDELQLDAEEELTWRAQVLGFRQYRQFPLNEELPGSGRWEAYLAYYIKNFSNANDIMDTFKPGKEPCSLLWSFSDKNNFGIIWKTLHTAYFTAYLKGGRCDKDKGRIAAGKPSNFEYAKETIALVAGRRANKFGLDNLMNTRRTLAANIGDACSSEFFSGKEYLYHWAITVPVCRIGPVLDLVPIVGTAKQFAEAIDKTFEKCARNSSNCGVDAVVLLGAASISCALDVLPGIGPIAKSTKATSRFLVKGSKLVIKYPGKVAREMLRSMQRTLKRSLEMTKIPSRIFKYASVNVLKELYTKTVHSAGLANVRRGLSEIIGEGAVDAFRAKELLDNAGFTTAIFTHGRNNFVEILSGPADKTWKRLDALLDFMKRERKVTMGVAGSDTSVLLGNRKFRLLIDTERVKITGQVGGAYQMEHRLIFLSPEDVWSSGFSVAGRHEIAHFAEDERLLRGLMSQYLGNVLGSAKRSATFGYPSFGFGEVKTWLGESRSTILILDEYLKRKPDFANLTLFEFFIASQNGSHIFNKALEQFRRSASFTLDLRDFAKLALERGANGQRKLATHFVHRSEYTQVLDRLGWQHVDAHFAVVATEKGKAVVVPLHFGANYADDLQPLLARGLTEEVAKQELLNTYLDQRLTRLVEKGDAAEAFSKKWFTDDGSQLTLDMNPYMMTKISDVREALLKDVLAADAAQPREFLELPPVK